MLAGVLVGWHMHWLQSVIGAVYRSNTEENSGQQ
jgi:hypothetical protein